MTETADEDASSERRTPQEPPEQEQEPEPEQPRVARPRERLTAAEREFIRRYAEDFPPHHDSRWG